MTVLKRPVNKAGPAGTTDSDQIQKLVSCSHLVLCLNQRLCKATAVCREDRPRTPPGDSLTQATGTPATRAAGAAR